MCESTSTRGLSRSIGICRVCPAQVTSDDTFAVPRVIMLYAIRLYALIAKKYATTVIPTHHARATHISFPIGSEFSRERTVSTIDVTGWFSANALTTAGIVAVGILNAALVAWLILEL